MHCRASVRLTVAASRCVNCNFAHGKMKKNCVELRFLAWQAEADDCADCSGCTHGKCPKRKCDGTATFPHGKLKRFCVPAAAEEGGKVKRNCVTAAAHARR